MDEELYSKLYGEDVAVAHLTKKGISFISMPKKYKEKKFRNNLYKEALSHETHHIIWWFLHEDKKIDIEEKDEDIWMAYRFFQDETIARLCSGGGFMGYSHLLLIDKGHLNVFKTRNPEKEKQINQQVIDLNTFMYDNIMPLMEKSGIEKKDLIFSIMRSRNFTDLKNNLKKFESTMRQKAKKMKKSEPQTKSSGWDTIRT